MHTQPAGLMPTTLLFAAPSTAPAPECSGQWVGELQHPHCPAQPPPTAAVCCPTHGCASVAQHLLTRGRTQRAGPAPWGSQELCLDPRCHPTAPWLGSAEEQEQWGTAKPI